MKIKVLCFLMVAAISVFGEIGKTKTECSAKYNVRIVKAVNEKGFFYNNKYIKLKFTKGKCDFISYSPKSSSDKFSDDTVRSLIKQNCKRESVKPMKSKKKETFMFQSMTLIVVYEKRKQFPILTIQKKHYIK